MKTKRILSCLIIAAMIFTIAGNFSVACAAADITHKAGLLAALQITDKTEKNVTRADFAEIIIKAMNLEKSADTSDNYEFSFADVEKTHTKYKYIMLAKLLGLMNGYSDTLFSPDAEITVGEALAVLVRALGDTRVENGMSVYASARDNNLLKNMKGTVGDVLSYEQMTILVYNFLHTNILSEFVLPYDGSKPGEGESVLYTYFKICVIEGIFTADSYIFADGESVGENYVRIGGKKLYTDTGVNEKYIGCNVRCYYKEDPQPTVFYTCPADGANNNVVVLALNGAENSGRQIKYGGKAYSYNANTVFIYNSEVVTSPSVLADAFSGTGTVKLIDNNGDAVYEYVIIEKIIVGVVEAINPVGEYIKLSGNTQAIYYNKYKSKAFRKADGTNISIDGISKDDVVGVAYPKTTDGAIKLVKCENLGAATIKSVDLSADTIFTDEGIEYKTTTEIANELVLGEEYDLYIDSAECLVYVKKTENERKRGYIINAGVKGAVSSAFELKLIDDTNEIKTFRQKDKVKVRISDGSFKKLKGAEIVQALLNANSGYIRQPVLYALSNDGTLAELWCLSADKNVEFHHLDSLLDDLSEAERGAMNYRSGAKSIGGKYVFTSDSILYRVPDCTAEVNDEKREFSVTKVYGNITSATNINLKSIRKYGDTTDGTTVVTAIAMKKGSFIADAFVFEAISGGTTAVGSDTTIPIIVTDIRYGNTDLYGDEYIEVRGHGDGGAVYSFCYYDDGAGLVGITNSKRTATDMQTGAAVYAPISRGDIIKYKTTETRNGKNNVEIYYQNDIKNNVTGAMGSDGISDPVSLDNLNIHMTYYSAYRYYDYSRVTPATIIEKDQNNSNYAVAQVCDVRNSLIDTGAADTRREVVYLPSIVYIYSKAERSIDLVSSEVISEGDTVLFIMSGGIVKYAVCYR